MTRLRIDRSEWLALLLMMPVILPPALVMVFAMGLYWTDMKRRAKCGVRT